MLGIRTGLALASLLLATSSFLHAQSITASLYGTVFDPGGAVVPGAVVRAIHVDTGTPYSFVADESGNFDFPQLRLGAYRVEAEKPGFRKLVRDGISLELNQRSKLDLTLQVGNVSETIEVSGQALLLETASAATGQVVTKKQVEDLPQVHRIPWYLAMISSGVNPQLGMDPGGHGFNRINNFSVNGSRGLSNEMQIDGVPNGVPEGGTSGASAQAVVIVPSPDATQEFRVYTNAYAAEFGKSGGGVITTTIKSGSNDFHGSVFNFFQNDKLNSNSWFSNRGGFPRGQLRRNQFGGAIGGPVIKNHTFFFFDYMGLRQRQANQPTRSSLATPAMMQGDFSNLRNPQGQLITIYDPTTAGSGQPRQPFAGNIIPKAIMDPTSLKIMSFLPTERRSAGDPFTGLGNNTYLLPRSTVDNQFDVKADHRFNSAHQIFFRYSFYHHDRDTPPTLPGSTWSNLNEADAGGNHGPVHNLQAVVGHTWVISPNTIFDWRGGYTRLFFAQTYHAGCQLSYCDTPFDPTNAGFPAYIRDFADTRGFPYLTFTDYNDIGSANQQYGIPDVISLQSSLTKIKGAHVLKFGFDGRRQHYIRGGGSNRVGAYNFTAGFTQQVDNVNAPLTQGNSWASFLLGAPATGSIQRVSFANVKSQYFAFYVQDDWKITRKLTLNLGLRYDVSQPMWDKFGQMSFLNLGTPNPIGPQVDLPDIVGGLQFANKGALKGVQNTITVDNNNLAPRLGLAYQITPKTVIRSGAGIFYRTILGEAVPPPRDSFSITTPMVTTLDGARPYNKLSNPFPNGIQEPRRGADGLLTNVGLSITGIAGSNSSITPYLGQWNLSIQRELPAGMVAEVAYVGSVAKQQDRRVSNLNELHPDYVSLGNSLNQLVPNPFFGNPNIPASSILAQPTVRRGQLLRRFPQFDAVTMWSYNGSSSSYNAFQVKVEKRFSHGITLLGSYTNSKLIDDYSGIPNWLGSSPPGDRTRYNFRREKSLNEEEVSQRFVGSYTYELPFGRGRHWMNTSPVLDAFLGGWQVNGIVTFSAGTPLYVTTSNVYHNFGAGEQRPNSVGRSAALDGPAQSRLGGVSGGTWFDTTAFSQPAPFTIGNLSRTLPDVRTDGIANLDFSLFKTFSYRDRWRLQYRVEMFNFLNTPTFGTPVTSAVSNQFGVVNGVRDSTAARQLQMALRLTF